VFRHAKQNGVIDGENPIRDAGIPKAAKMPDRGHAYSVEEVFTMLHTLTGVARASVALCFFAGLRPGEARAMRWDDYDETKNTLRVRASMWRTQIGTPKTEESAGVVPVAQILADILSETPHLSEFILAGLSGRPVDFHNLVARVIVPSLTRCSICNEAQAEHDDKAHAFVLDESLPKWKGFYALRRGLATAATSVDSALAAKSLLRHANISTTQAHYIQSVAQDAQRAMDKIDALFDNANGSARPN
jgi:integrase